MDFKLRLDPKKHDQLLIDRLMWWNLLRYYLRAAGGGTSSGFQDNKIKRRRAHFRFFQLAENINSDLSEG